MARKTQGLNKMQLVRDALAAGIDKPTDIVAKLAEQGVTMSTNQVSNYKSVLKNANGKPKGKPGRKPTVAVAAMMPSTNGAKQFSPKTSHGGFSSAVATIKMLCQRIGKDEVVKLAELF